jgi:KaiC/GvpD/RAD55 family RecA-like ATPase
VDELAGEAEGAGRQAEAAPVTNNVRPLHPAWREQAKADDAKNERRFEATFPEEFPSPEPPKLIRDFIAHTDLVLVYGGWGSGKSFFVIDLAGCLASGDFWRGRACDPGLVVYVAGEAPKSIKSRIKAWLLRRGKLRKGLATPPIAVVSSAPDLLNGGDDVEALAQELDITSKACDAPLRAIVFDTVHACAPGSREDAADFGAMLSRVRPLIDRFGCAIFLVHHAGKDASRGARGSVSLEAAADVIIEVAEDGGIRTPSVRKLRDGALPELEPFKVDAVVFGQGTDNEVRVGVHELVEPPEDPGDPRKAKAMAMRKEGISFPMIGKALGISVSTAERWCKGRSH